MISLQKRVDNLEKAFVIHEKRLRAMESSARSTSRRISKIEKRNEGKPCIGFVDDGTAGDGA